MNSLGEVMNENYKLKGEEKRRVSNKASRDELFCLTLKMDVEQLLVTINQVSAALENEHPVMAMKWATVARLIVEAWIEKNVREVE